MQKDRRVPYRLLILLFGHENDTHGNLSAVAQARCDEVLKCLDKYPNAHVLPTGAFGEHFNTTDQPHSYYLAEYLKRKGVTRKAILSGTDSSNTLEDCICARKIAIERGFSRVIAVTSDYHMPRVKFILEHIFDGIAFSPQPAPTPAECRSAEEQEERKRYKRLRSDWPLKYTSSGDRDLDKMVYEEAVGEHRHYDTVSLAVVTAMLVVGAFPFVTMTSMGAIEKLSGMIQGKEAARLFSIVFWVAAGIDFLLLHIYLRAAYSARVARRTLKNIEIARDCRGFSANYDSSGSWAISITAAVMYLGLGLTVILTATGAILWCGWPPRWRCLIVVAMVYLAIWCAGRFGLPAFWRPKGSVA